MINILSPFSFISVRFQELDFEVKAYNDYKRDEVLDKIKEGNTLFYLSNMTLEMRAKLKYSKFNTEINQQHLWHFIH